MHPLYPKADAAFSDALDACVEVLNTMGAVGSEATGEAPMPCRLIRVFVERRDNGD